MEEKGEVMDMLDLWFVVGESLLFLMFVSVELWVGGWSCRLPLDFCLPIWLTELNF